MPLAAACINRMTRSMCTLSRVVDGSCRRRGSNTHVGKKELLAALYAMRTRKVYLIDKRFEIITDHRTLESILKPKRVINGSHDG